LKLNKIFTTNNYENGEEKGRRKRKKKKNPMNEGPKRKTRFLMYFLKIILELNVKLPVMLVEF